MGTDRIAVFQDLHLRQKPGGAPIRDALLEQVRAPWHHEPEREALLRSPGPHDKDVIALSRDAFDGIDAATLVLWEESGGYHISNIVPQKVGQLSILQYNRILQDFLVCIADPAGSVGALLADVTPAEQSLGDWLAPEAASALERFSLAANKSTGSAHPLDQQRWFQFLIAAHRSSSKLGPGELTRWLVELEHWPEDIAHELAVEYEGARALLHTYDAYRS